MALSILELATRKTAVLERIDESIVEKVIRFKWKSVHEASGKNNTVEDSGLGKFKVRPNMVKNRLIKIDYLLNLYTQQLTEEQSERKQQTLNRKISNLLLDKEYLKTKQENEL